MCIFRNDEDYFVDCDAKLEDVSGEDLGNSDNDEEILDEDPSDEEYFDCLESFDVELDPTFRMPYNVAPDTDPACLLLDKLIRDGKYQKIATSTKTSLK